MSKVQILRKLVSQRQTAAAEEIIKLFERSIAEYRDVCYPREEDNRQRNGTGLPLRAEVQQVIVGEQVPSGQQEWSPSVDPEPPHIKRGTGGTLEHSGGTTASRTSCL
ncbi:uncharacterized protein LOC120793500 isoform X2 [Xiphias gladius]|uniref:uncharacterized protein LOC120793500 isoform X2 n=1 Tax=Xiphias gladius TaxID=8245 RepID=UPI001A99329A|nr:uncharacterized protein LOC120793500 isoform X2 [Xiphias gladius]